jgi:hypothetical protein
VGRKVPSVALRLNAARPSWKSIAGLQVPKSDEETEALAFVDEEVVAREVADEVVLEMGTQEVVAAVAKRRARRRVGVCILIF